MKAETIDRIEICKMIILMILCSLAIYYLDNLPYKRILIALVIIVMLFPVRTIFKEKNNNIEGGQDK